MYRLPPHTSCSIPAHGATSTRMCLIWPLQSWEKQGVLIPQRVGRVCTGKGWQLSPKINCCGHPSSSLPCPWGFLVWASWILWANFLHVALLHRLCASEKLWVGSAQAAYSTTGLSDGTDGLNLLTSFFGSSVICLCSNLLVPVLFFWTAASDNSIVSQTGYWPPNGTETCLERKQKLLVWLRHLHVFCRSREIAKKTWCNSGEPGREREEALLTCD